MDKQRLDFLHYAEQDYIFVAQSYKAGVRGNPLCYLAEQACEKYIKHLLCLLRDEDACVPKEATQYDRLTTHHPGKLARVLKNEGLAVTRDFIQHMNFLQSFYRDVRYPGYYTSRDADSEDIHDCMRYMKECREFTFAMIKVIENQKIIAKEQEIEEIDFDDL